MRVDGLRRSTAVMVMLALTPAVVVAEDHELTLEEAIANALKKNEAIVVEHESLVDWLSFHHNEKGEWLRFGAAIYLQTNNVSTLVGVHPLHLGVQQ